MNKIVIITGLTASGKSGLAVKIAKQFNGEIISCDSVQVYRGLDIGSAKVEKEVQAEVSHHLIDIVEPTENYNVGRFLSDCKIAVEDCIKRNKLPIIVGGTGMYVKAILEGYDLGESRDDSFRIKWEQYADRFSKKAVWDELNKRNEELAEKVHFNNLKRVIRYLEFASGKVPAKAEPIFSNYQILAIGIDEDRTKIYDKINKRVDEMLKQGLIEEVKTLIEKGLDLSYNSMNTIGYREIYQYLTNEITFDKAVELIKQHTRNYAKRQLTFMKTINELKFFNLSDAEKNIIEFLKEEG